MHTLYKIFTEQIYKFQVELLKSYLFIKTFIPLTKRSVLLIYFLCIFKKDITSLKKFTKRRKVLDDQPQFSSGAPLNLGGIGCQPGAQHARVVVGVVEKRHLLPQYCRESFLAQSRCQLHTSFCEQCRLILIK